MNLWDVFLSIFWFMILLAWIMLLISILTDVFRDHEMSGWAKAGWVIFLVLVPWLAAVVYLIARGSSMNERARDDATRRYQAYGGTVGHVATSADELTKLTALRDKGALSEEEFERAKASVLSYPPPSATPSAASTAAPAAAPSTTASEPDTASGTEDRRSTLSAT